MNKNLLIAVGAGIAFYYLFLRKPAVVTETNPVDSQPVYELGLFD